MVVVVVVGHDHGDRDGDGDEDGYGERAGVSALPTMHVLTTASGTMSKECVTACKRLRREKGVTRRVQEARMGVGTE